MDPCFKEITCRPYHWEFKDRELDERGRRLCIDTWCLDRENEPVLLRIEDFPALCMVELPGYINGVSTNWNGHNADLLMNEISYRFKKSPPANYKLRLLKKIYFFKGKRKYPFLQCFFNSYKSMLEFKYSIDNQPLNTKSFGTVLLRVWENNISPVRKLKTALNIKTCQWIKCTGEMTDEMISTCKQEYKVKFANIEGLPKEVTKEWYTYPRIFVYDIECYAHKRGTFPQSLVLKDCAFMISCIYQRVGHKDTRRRYAIVWGECSHIPEDKMRDTKVINVNSEMELISKFGELVNKYDPEIFSGYNINKFDAPYLDNRLKLYMRDWPNMSRIPMEPTVADTSDWESRAFGFVSVTLLKCQGRITFDLFPFAERQFKLHKYDLNTVSKFVLKRGKHDVSAQYMFDTFAMTQRARKDNDKTLMEEATKRMDKVLLYCIEDSELVLDIFEGTNVWVSSVEFASVSGINIQDLYVRGQQISSYSLIYNKAVSRGYVINNIDMSTMENMDGGFVRTPKKGLHDKVFDVDFTSLYPSIIISENMCYTTLVPPEMNDIVNDEDFNVIEFDQEETIETPEDEDGMSLFAGSDSEESFIGGKGFESADPDKPKTVTKHYVRKYFKGEVIRKEVIDGVTKVIREKGIVPEVLSELLGERKKIKEEIKALYKKYGYKLEKISEEKEKARIEFRLVVLDKIQWSLKIRANSIFGFFGARKGRLPLLDIAACVTAVGRQHIGKVDQYAEERGCEVVYNDTDSSFMKVPSHVPTSEITAFGKQFGTDVSKLFPDGVDAVWEKSMRILCLKKKKYAYLIYDDNGKLILDRNNMGQKGIMSARRDNCQWARDTYNEILWQTMIETPVYYTIRFLYDETLKLLNGEVPMEDLIIIRKMGAVYKNNNFFMKVFADRMKALGRPIEPGERIGYIIVKKENAKLLGERMITDEMYRETLGTENEYQIDYEYYLEKGLQSHVDQIISIVYADDLKHIDYKANNRCKVVYFSEPVAFMCKMIKYNLSITELESYIEDLKPITPRISRKK